MEEVIVDKGEEVTVDKGEEVTVDDEEEIIVGEVEEVIVDKEEEVTVRKREELEVDDEDCKERLQDLLLLVLKYLNSVGFDNIPPTIESLDCPAINVVNRLKMDF